MAILLRDIAKLIISLDSSETVQEAARMMVKRGIGSVVVTKEGEYIGILTKTDIMKKVTSEGRPAAEVRVSKIMSSPLITIDAQTPIGDAVLKMQAEKVRRLLVIDDGKIVGIITEKDLLESVMKTLLTFLKQY
jgi:CBS domain-containing protein